MHRKAYGICLFLLAAVLIIATAACGRRGQGEENTPTGVEDSEQNTPSQNQKEDLSEQSDNTEDKSSDEMSDQTNQKEEEQKQDQAEPEDLEDDMKDTDNEDTETKPTAADANGQAGGPERIGIYTIDEETLETVSLTALIDTSGGLTPKAVVDAVVLSLEDHLIEIQIAGITVSEGKATVDIQAEDAKQPFGNTGSSVEGVILDCITYSLFDNFKEIKELYFTVNGGAYESGHISLAEGEAYQTK